MSVDASWVLASRNPGKLVELRALFRSNDIDVVDLREAGVSIDDAAEERIEMFDTFEENALAKARYFSARLPGRVVVADDSGLCVDSLAGEPGVRSKRWSGVSAGGSSVDSANNTKLIASLSRHSNRDAQFVCAAALCNGVQELVTRGEVRGHITVSPSGEQGFGYDPYFFADELGMTLADATVAEKERVSHRARAFVSLLAAVRAGC